MVGIPQLGLGKEYKGKKCIQGWANAWLKSTSTPCQKIVLLLQNNKLKAFT